jgi:hypothetical protein
MTALELTQESKRTRRYILGVWCGLELATHYSYASWGGALQMHDVFRDNCNPQTTHYTLHDPEYSPITLPVVTPVQTTWNATRLGDLRYIRTASRRENFDREVFIGPFEVVNWQHRMLRNMLGGEFIHHGAFYWLPLSRDKEQAA